MVKGRIVTTPSECGPGGDRPWSDPRAAGGRPPATGGGFARAGILAHGLMGERRRPTVLDRPQPVGTAPMTLVTWTPRPGSEPIEVASPKAKTPPSEPMSQ